MKYGSEPYLAAHTILPAAQAAASGRVRSPGANRQHKYRARQANGEMVLQVAINEALVEQLGIDGADRRELAKALEARIKGWLLEAS